ncbi:MAG TPA: ATP-binding protein [Ktedonobacteraceae bacterium]|nr:ATP-binding protein [Ktedonobacteraceae bacterium]
MMSVERDQETQKRLGTWLDANSVLSILLEEYSAVTDYRTLRDSVPRRLAALLQCRCVLLYQHSENTLHFVSGFFDSNEKSGWSSSLLSVAHINPIDLRSDSLEATAWRLRLPAISPPSNEYPTHVAVPLLYRQRGIGVLVAIREGRPDNTPSSWHPLDIQVIKSAASILAMLLENTRLLERDRERIHELSLLNNISSQLNSAGLSSERIRSIIIQRAHEIASPDFCELLLPAFKSLAVGSIPWLSEELQALLLRYVGNQHEQLPPGSSALPQPLILERPGGGEGAAYLARLPALIKTFVAIPLCLPRSPETSNAGWGSLSSSSCVGAILVGYHRPRKLRSGEKMLLQVLANQASSAFEQLRLVEELVEARNEARKLLRQVLDDQRLKELILESIPSGLITIDQRGLITTFNRAAASILGYHAFEVIGQPVQQFLGEVPLSRCRELLPGTATVPPEALVISLNQQHRDGHDLFLDLSLVPLRDDHGQPVGTLVTVTDITAMRRLEQEKQRLDRLASLGEMSASVAHEVRNPLASMKTTMQMLMSDLSDGVTEGADESITVVLKEIERVDLIVRDLLDFARPRQIHRIEFDLPLLCDRVISLMQAQFEAANVEVHRHYQEIPLLLADIGQMEQVLLNLYTNALQAMPEGGVLSIACQLVNAETSEQAHVARYWVELLIRDTGIGIAPEQRERLFQPFFTTKAHGIGLGLPITRRLVEDHKGQIGVESQLGHGATISVRLPLIEQSIQEPSGLVDRNSERSHSTRKIKEQIV